ncbi:MAG: translation elongation factor 4 [Patescibacteria group bacterium]
MLGIEFLGLNIRNFVIIAHIDHGKSTLADRFLELTGTIEKRKMHEQVLDVMDLERERGITIKMQPVRMKYKLKVSAGADPTFGGKKLKIDDVEAFHFELFTLNLIDTPGHIDFTYEVSRSLAAVEGAILLIDATQGVQAQTVGNLMLARKEKLAIIPVLNKVDLKEARIEEVEAEIRKLLPEYAGVILRISAKTGEGVEELLRMIIEKVPPPRAHADGARMNAEEGEKGKSNEPFRALIFDSKFDPYKGVIAFVRVFEGTIRGEEKITLLATGAESEVLEVGYFVPNLYRAETLSFGEIGYIATGLKEPGCVRVGDTITRSADILKQHSIDPFAGYIEPQPMIFASIYPEDAEDFDNLRDALLKLKLSDPSFSFEIESSDSLGRGFRAGFLGMLHIEIIKERLYREYNLDLIFSTPSVSYRVTKNTGEVEIIHAPSQIPDSHARQCIEEPWVNLEIITPKRYLGNIMKILDGISGVFGAMEYLGEERLLLKYEAPLRSIVIDFYDHLKSASEGYASMRYELIGFRRGDLERLDILVAGKRVHAFSMILEKKRAYDEGKKVLEKLKDLIPRQLFMVALQASIDGRIISRENIAAAAKNVTQHMYGGDRTRKMKLWKKQKEGKKRMQNDGTVDIPQDVYLKIFQK